MLESVKYLIGSVGASGYGSKSTAEEVTGSSDLRSVTAIITGITMRHVRMRFRSSPMFCTLRNLLGDSRLII
ncbi:hypothetical protein PanWU01x14_057730 [Parasponia andersonii]|uniref:Uncharacterized protein n=1 Tax=Parasponia andersonii TaxID=3476 RepID=A0A2P5DJX1_PARAD|nr:hypothetical protein PanWU01x14_057730 [Parasponia andersonii]